MPQTLSSSSNLLHPRTKKIDESMLTKFSEIKMFNTSELNDEYFITKGKKVSNITVELIHDKLIFLGQQHQV